LSENVLKFTFLGDNKFSKPAKEVERSTDSMGAKIGKFGKFAGTALIGVGTAMGTMAAAGAVMGVKTAASLEQAQIGFATMLHSGQKAQVFLKQLTSFAAATPFELKGLVDSSRLLIGVGLNTKQTMKVLKDFGDTAGAVGIQQDGFQRIMLALSQSIAAGKLKLGDMNQLMNNGLPIWKLLSEAIHKPVPEIQNMISHGQLLTKDVLPKLEAQMHKDYGGSMAKQSQTLNGLWSTFTDTLSLGLGKAITPMIPALKTDLTGATVIAGKALQKLPGIIDTMIGAFKVSRDFVDHKLVPSLKTGFDFVKTHLPNINISGLGKTFQADAKTWGGSIITGVQTGLKTGNWRDLGSTLGEGLSTALTSAISGGVKIGAAIGKWFASVDWLNVGKSAGLAAAPFILGFSLTLIDGLVNAFKAHPGEVLFAIATMIPVGKLLTAFKPLRAVLEALPFGKWIAKGLDKTASPVFDAIWSFIRFMGREFMAGFRAADGLVGGAVGRFVRGIGDEIGLRSLYLADRVTEFFGGISRGAGRMAGRISFTIRQVIGWQTRPFVNAGSWLVRAGRDLVGGSIRGIGSMGGPVGRATSTAIRWLVRPFARAGEWLFQPGRELLRGLRDGMINGVQGAGAWAANVGGKIVRAVKGFFGIKSPSRVFTGIGKNLITSLFGAMIDHNPVQAITKIFGGMPQALGALVDKGLVHITSLPGKALSALSGLGGKFASVIGSASGIAIGGASAAEQWIINHESGGRTTARNPTSTAFGLGQLILANRIAYGRQLGVDPNTTNASAQLAMMRMYIHDRYGTAENAEAFWKAHHWYDSGGEATGSGFLAKRTLQPERVLSPAQTRDFNQLVRVLDRQPTIVTTGGDGTGIDYAKLGRYVAEAIGRGGLQVTLDGKAVGAVMGGQANALRRAG
jgi:tape measure domain-containing protein